MLLKMYDNGGLVSAYDDDTMPSEELPFSMEAGDCIRVSLEKMGNASRNIIYRCEEDAIHSFFVNTNTIDLDNVAQDVGTDSNENDIESLKAYVSISTNDGNILKPIEEPSDLIQILSALEYEEVAYPQDEPILSIILNTGKTYIVFSNNVVYLNEDGVYAAIVTKDVIGTIKRLASPDSF